MMKVAVYLDNQFISYANFPDEDQRFDFEMFPDEACMKSKEESK